MIRKPRIRRRNYWAVRVDGKYILEHRHVMERHLGRPLTEEEAVHHINHITTDNRFENLELCATHGAHTKDHHSDLFEKQRILFKRKHFSLETELKLGKSGFWETSLGKGNHLGTLAVLGPRRSARNCRLPINGSTRLTEEVSKKASCLGIRA